ncbi:tRNA (5-methylaminomethyl-2-thiouridine)(34)-methyltransferase MnmD [Flavobacterium sp.]|uniref:tRNA (5-methylaminomethyl-2-thiouridine)(34)-methyltransferase MnmD n=1 Tax=Flavobacterium sp. TaxID=239 RepID=UPI003D299EF6
MKREIIITNDGSSSIYIPELNETYHSKNGAIQEAYHVFINAGFSQINKNSINILEIGFGTGLNAFITYLEAKKTNTQINYIGVEAYPVSHEEIKVLNYVQELNAKSEQGVYDSMHHLDWGVENEISPQFKITKRKQLFQDINDIECYDLIYFDAFGFSVQPELWSEEIFQAMYNSLLINGVLVTYACRGSIKRAMLKAGFKVEKLPGAPGKREMLRATKI